MTEDLRTKAMHLTKLEASDALVIAWKEIQKLEIESLKNRAEGFNAGIIACESMYVQLASEYANGFEALLTQDLMKKIAILKNQKETK